MTFTLRFHRLFKETMGKLRHTLPVHIVDSTEEGMNKDVKAQLIISLGDQDHDGNVDVTVECKSTIPVFSPDEKQTIFKLGPKNVPYEQVLSTVESMSAGIPGVGQFVPLITGALKLVFS